MWRPPVRAMLRAKCKPGSRAARADRRALGLRQVPGQQQVGKKGGRGGRGRDARRPGAAHHGEARRQRRAASAAREAAREGGAEGLTAEPDSDGGGRSEAAHRPTHQGSKARQEGRRAGEQRIARESDPLPTPEWRGFRWKSPGGRVRRGRSRGGGEAAGPQKQRSGARRCGTRDAESPPGQRRGRPQFQRAH